MEGCFFEKGRCNGDMVKKLKDQAFTGFLWSFGERFGNQISDFVISIILARLLAPKEFGLIAMVTVFIALLTPFIDAGLGSALIRKQKPSEEDYSTVFWWNIGLAILVYFLLYLGAPLVSNFYDEPLLTDILRVLGLTVIIQSFAIVQATRLTKALNFRVLSTRSLISNVLSGILGLYLAFEGWSYWALIIRQIVNSIISTVLLWGLSNWKPLFTFSISSFKEFFGFGSKLLISGLLDTGFNNIYPLLIGKYFSASSLGFYNRAKAFKDIPQNMVTQVISRVTYPIFAELQHDPVSLRLAYKRLVQLISFIYFPALFGLMGISKLLVLVLLTDKWIETVPMLRGLAIVGLLYPIHSLNLNILTVKGRSDLFLNLEVVKKSLTVVMILIFFRWGIMGLIYGQIIQSWIALIINTYYSKKIIGYGFLSQVKDIFPHLAIAGTIGLIILLGSDLLNIYTWWSLSLWIVLGVIAYLLFSILIKSNELTYIIEFLKGKYKVFRAARYS